MEIDTPVAPGEATQNNTPAPVAQENPELAAPEPDAEGQAADQQEEATSPEDEAAKAIKRMERRIARLTAARYEAEAKAKQAAEEAQRYRQQYEQPQQEQQQQVDPIQLAAQIATLQTVTQRANEVARKGAEKFPDFGEAVKTVNEEAGPLFTQQGFPTALGEAVLDADDPPKLLHYLGKHPEVAAELHGLTPIQVAKRIARIEARMSEPPKVSQAPKAIKPPAGSRVVNDLSAIDDPIEWRRRFLEERTKR